MHATAIRSFMAGENGGQGRRSPAREMQSPPANLPGPSVSVIVPTRNSASTLERCLKSLRSQTYPRIEILVVDNHSSDATAEIARAYANQVIAVGPERCQQINAGARAAKGDYLYCVNSDFIFESTIVAEAVAACLSGADAVVLPNRSDPSISFWSRVRALERDCYLDDSESVAARFFRRHVFFDVGGYDESLVAAEDYDLHARLLEAGYKIGRTKVCEWHIGEPKSLREVAGKHYYYGTTLRNYANKRGRDGVRRLLPFRKAYLRHWRDFLSHPIITLGFIVYLFVKYGYGLMGYILSRRVRSPYD
jgi:glycosyltransferase involved in cell wall biosynthesis